MNGGSVLDPMLIHIQNFPSTIVSPLTTIDTNMEMAEWMISHDALCFCESIIMVHCGPVCDDSFSKIRRNVGGNVGLFVEELMDLNSNWFEINVNGKIFCSYFMYKLNMSLRLSLLPSSLSSVKSRLLSWKELHCGIGLREFQVTAGHQTLVQIKIVK